MFSNQKSRLVELFFTGTWILAACAAASTPSPSSATQPPATAESTPPLEGDLCLPGTWVMPTADLDLMIATLLPIPGVRVPAGELLMIFDGSTYRYLSYGFILHMDLGTDRYMESTASFENSGSFSAANGRIAFSSVTSESEISSWTGYKNGETYTVPGAAPEVNFYLGGENPYRCSTDRLEIDTFHPTLETMTLFFMRQS